MRAISDEGETISVSSEQLHQPLQPLIINEDWWYSIPLHGQYFLTHDLLTKKSPSTLFLQPRGRHMQRYFSPLNVLSLCNPRLASTTMGLT